MFSLKFTNRFSRLGIRALAGTLAFCIHHSALASPTDPLDALAKRSPFLPAGYVPGRGKPDARPNSRVEFGGYLDVDGKLEFSLLNPATGDSAWVALRDPQAPYFVESFDPAGPAIVVKLDGVSLRLPLRNEPAAPESSAAPGQPPAPTQARILDPGAPAPGSPTAAPASVSTGDAPPAEPNRIPRQSLRTPPRADDLQ